MLIHHLNKQNIQSSFAHQDYQKGYEYYLEKRVTNFELIQESQKREVIHATVLGGKEYRVKIELENINSKIHLWGSCSCPLISGCKHVVAALLMTLDQDKAHYTKTPTDHKVTKWLNTLSQNLDNTSSESFTPGRLSAKEEYCLYFLITASIHNNMDLNVQITYSKRLKSGKWGALKDFSLTDTLSKSISFEDETLLLKLEGAKQMVRLSRYSSNYPLEGKTGELLLKELLSTQRCYWESKTGNPLTLGQPEIANWHWVSSKNGFQKLHYHAGKTSYSLHHIDQMWYHNEETNEMGLFETDLSKKAIKLLLSAPPIPTGHVKEVANLLTKHKQILSIQPPKLSTHKKTKLVAPVPCLSLYQTNIVKPFLYRNEESTIEKQPVAVLTFDYKGIQVTEKDQESIIAGTDIQRDIPKEVAYIKQLTHEGWQALRANASLRQANSSLFDHYLFDTKQNDLLQFSGAILPELRAQGWRIEISEDYPYQFVEESIDEWYSSIDETETESGSGYDWFGLELGISVKGEKINLLPVLQRLLPTLKVNSNGETTTQPTDTVFAQLSDGRYIPLPTERVRQILNILVELYDSKSLNADDKLKLSKLHAMRLLELEAAIGAAKLRWFGGQKLRQMADKLAQFKGIKTVQPPAEFQGKLRPYQIDGLSWLQFLREYRLSGILADDMGLGKTIQALSHILLEKISGRMKAPSLIIAPTSLMFNWRMETERFTPDLKILILHGTERKQDFDQINQYDLVLTTYPLLVRDKDILLAQSFYLFILDEAQNIKNAKTQAAHIALQIKASHRLCLTGTPMENHLGELWSLFHFMMPGLLGDQTQFTRLFRTPIEKHGDHDRRTHLNRRVAPFMLRRTKDTVIKELPAKIETVHYVELDGPQRDLYETIRMTMQKKIRDQVAQMGLGRSHIVILDALLKLRQVCCDPRLLKISDDKKKQAKSAKLELLMNFITELLEENRRILLFSQFTEMLSLIEDELTQKGIDYVKLTGQTKNRQIPVEQFQTGNVPLFLISLKAGGTGLNLTAADTVIHYDPWWNPAVENQATDRAHRIGQNKTVFVYKFVAKGTVEEKILEMQRHKGTLMENLFSEKTASKLKLTEEDLRNLFEPLNVDNIK